MKVEKLIIVINLLNASLDSRGGFLVEIKTVTIVTFQKPVKIVTNLYKGQKKDNMLTLY